MCWRPSVQLNLVVCPSGQGDGLEIHWASPAQVRVLSQPNSKGWDPSICVFVLLWTRKVATRRKKALLQVRAAVVQGTEAICIREERKNRGWAEQDRGCGWRNGRRKRSTNAALCTFMSDDKLHQWIPNSKMYSLLATGSPHPALLSFPCVYFLPRGGTVRTCFAPRTFVYLLDVCSFLL